MYCRRPEYSIDTVYRETQSMNTYIPKCTDTHIYIYIYIFERETSVCMCYTITVKQKTQRLFDEFSYSFNT